MDKLKKYFLFEKIYRCNEDHEFLNNCALAVYGAGLTIPIIIAVIVIIILISTYWEYWEFLHGS